MRMTEDEFKRLHNVKVAANSCHSVADLMPAPKVSKYNNKKVEVDGIKFDSKREYARWNQLKIMERAGAISDLKRQVPFELAPSVQLGGRKKPALRYVADFTYTQGGKMVVEDAKGMLTDVYRIKKHLMLSVHGIEIKES